MLVITALHFYFFAFVPETRRDGHAGLFGRERRPPRSLVVSVCRDRGAHRLFNFFAQRWKPSILTSSPRSE